MSPYIRKRLPHDSPNWIKDGETYFITINCLERGRNQLAQADTATAIKQAFIAYAESGKWFPHLVIVMPDHIHALLGLNTGKYSIKGIVSPWKAYLKKTLKIQWQEGFFEHRIRNYASFEEKSAYIRSNPVRAGLAKMQVSGHIFGTERSWLLLVKISVPERRWGAARDAPALP